MATSSNMPDVPSNSSGGEPRLLKRQRMMTTVEHEESKAVEPQSSVIPSQVSGPHHRGIFSAEEARKQYYSVSKLLPKE